MREPAREILAGEEAWVVGGAVRDELLGREVIDLDMPPGLSALVASRMHHMCPSAKTSSAV